MTDREHDFGEAIDCKAPPNCREKNTSAGMQPSSETPPVGAMPIDRSAVAAQPVTAMRERPVIAGCPRAAQGRRLIAQSTIASWSAAVRDAAAGKRQSIVRLRHRKAPCRALEDS